MTQVVFHDSKTSLDSAAITQLEHEQGITLPDAYKLFLLTHNGGYPEPNMFPIQGFAADDRGILEWFLCLQEGDQLDIRRYVTVYTDRLPHELLPIAIDPGGNLICLAVRGEYYGKIYYWDHEGEVPEGVQPNYDNVYLIAEDFDSLIRNLSEI